MRELEQQRKGRNKNTIIDYNYISSNRYRKKFDYISNDKKLNKLLLNHNIVFDYLFITS